MKKILGNLKSWSNMFLCLAILTIAGCGSMKTTTEEDTIEKADIGTVSGYTDSIKYAVQVINVDMTKILQLYPDLQDKNVGLGFAESVLDYLDETGRFIFTEEKSEIKERMVTQFKASKKGVGLGFAESVLDYLDETGRFIFTEEKSEIKERMVTQFKASKKGVFEEPIDGKGKIKAARYLVYVTVADFAVDENGRPVKHGLCK